MWDRSVGAHVRAIGIGVGLCILGGALVGCVDDTDDADDASTESLDSVAQALATDETVYTNGAPASPWQNWSWRTTVALANTDAPLASGSSSHIKATVSSSGGALALAHASGDLAVSEYESISFDVRGPSSSNISLRVQTLAGTDAGVQVSVPVTTAWTRKTIALSSLRGTLGSFGKIAWVGTANGQTFYVDKITVVAKKAATTVPVAPLTVTKASVVTLSSSKGPYSVYVPSSYDATHRTPTKVLLWMHGCGGNAYGDAWAVSPGGSQSWISVTVGGRDGDCWDPSTDAPMVLAALDDVQRRLNVDRRRVVIGGYSSGGDMAYRTAFYNASRFAGIIAENTSPFRDTGSSQASSIAAASWRLNVVHLAHTSDVTYPIAGVRTETNALKSAGFPMTRIERPGTHWDPDTSTTGTNRDMRVYLLPYLDAGWTSP
ncbi:MAG: hypothetical protein JST00_42870 [Deltaproteobacteria bacterium]|nr:hypothetical protein [Deltaproteobacteria bacterium]